MTIVEAIKQVMAEAGCALTPRETYHRIVQQSLYVFQARNPQQIVVTQIRRHCEGLSFPSASPTKHFKTEGESRYVALARPVVLKVEATSAPTASRLAAASVLAMTETLPQMEANLWRLHKEYIDLFREHMLQELMKLTPAGFEGFARDLLDAYGFKETEVTAISRDGGIDGHGRLRVGLAHLKVAFQCKRWSKGRVYRPEIDKFRGASQGAYEQGIFFTTSSFAEGAIAASIQPGAIPIVLIDGPAIVDLMIEKQFRVQSSVMDIPAIAL